MASEKRRDMTASSYLQQYISRTTEPQRGCPDPPPNCDDDDTPDAPHISSESCLHGQRDEFRNGREVIERSNADQVQPELPGSTPLRTRPAVPQPQPPLPVCDMRRTLEIAPVGGVEVNKAKLRHNVIGNVGVGVGAGIGIGVGVDVGDHRRRIKADAYMMTEQRDPTSASTYTSFQPAGADRPRLASYSSLHRDRLNMGSPESVKRTRRRAEEGRPMSAEESRALFWEESKSLDAMSTKANSDWNGRPIAGGGCISEREGTSFARVTDESATRLKGCSRQSRAQVNGDASQSVPGAVGYSQGSGAPGQSKTNVVSGLLNKPSGEEEGGARRTPNQWNRRPSISDSLSVGAPAKMGLRAGQDEASKRSSTRLKASSERATPLLGNDQRLAFSRGPWRGRAARPTPKAGDKNFRPVPTTELPMGQALRTVKGVMAGDGTKLSVVGKHITSLGGVSPSVSSRATHLFVSNNSLQSLRGLERFSGVTCLSLTHNLIHRSKDLHPLTSLARLETLSLEGNPVCSTPNYRAHVIALASPCLKTLDRREVTVAEATEAPAIVAAERSLVDKTSRQRCRCIVLDHMSGLFECHAQLREALLTSWSDGLSRLQQRPEAVANVGMDCTSRVWRQRPTMTTPVHQILTIVQVESWSSFEHSELELVERGILDEAAELFAEIVTSRRAEGQRIHQLLEGATACLDSPSTGAWVQVLGELQRQTQVLENDVISRCEAVRERESESFLEAPPRAIAFLQRLASRVGHSDDQWAIPSSIEPTPAARGTRVRNTASRQSGASRDKTKTVHMAVSPPESLACPASSHSSAALAGNGHFSGRTGGADRRRKYGFSGGSVSKSQQQQGLRAPLPAIAKDQGLQMAGGGRVELEPALNATQDRTELSDEDASVMKVMKPPAPSEQPRRPMPRPRPVQPSTQGGRSARGKGAVQASTSAHQTTTMTSAANFLLARGKPLDFELSTATLSEEHADGTAEGPGLDEWGTLEARRSVSDGVIDRSSYPSEDAPYGLRTRGSLDSPESPGEADDNLSRESREIGPRSASAAQLPLALQQQARGRRGPDCPPPMSRRMPRTADCTQAAADIGLASTFEKRQTDLRKDNDDGRTVDHQDRAAGTKDGYDGQCESLEATRRLLLEASSVKRLLESMDRTDVSTADADEGLEDEVPDRFLAKLGLVEFKPLAQKLAMALDRAPEGLFADPSLCVAEPRTIRALRNQVAALGKEITRRAETCAEARKLNASLRRLIEVARRTRAKNLDTVDVACRKLIAGSVEEAEVLQESWGVAREAERYHEALTRLQEQVESTTAKTQQIVSSSEALARLLHDEMERQDEELSQRRHVAEDGLAEWEQAAEDDPALRARRRLYDCEILVLSHRMAGGGANRTSLAIAFYSLRERTERQRRARQWFSEAKGRRDAHLTRAAFDALAHGSRLKAVVAAAAVGRCRPGFAAWRKETALTRRLRGFRWARDRVMAAAGLRRWRQRVGKRKFGNGWGIEVVEGEEVLEQRLSFFRERRAKRVVLRAWHGAVQAATVVEMRAESGARRSVGRSGRGRRQFSWPARRCGGILDRDEVSLHWNRGARLRNTEALARRLRFETQGRHAFRWWWRQCRSAVLGKAAGYRRALRRWRHWTSDSRGARRALAEARERYVVTLGRRVMIAWSVVAATRARRKAGAALLATSLSLILRRKACRRWAFRAASAAVEAEQTMAALEHCYDGCLRSHLCAWLALTKERRLLRRGVELLIRDRRAVLVSTGFRLWRRAAARVRETVLRNHRVKAWAADAARRRRLAALAVSFHAWSRLCCRATVIHSLTIRAADRTRRLALTRGFRSLCLYAHRGIAAIERRRAVRAKRRGTGANHHQLGEDKAAEAVATAFRERSSLEQRVNRLRAQLAEERALALERRAEAGRIAEEIRRSERERVRYVKRLQQEEARSAIFKSSSVSAFVDSGSPRRQQDSEALLEEDCKGLPLAPSLCVTFPELSSRQGEIFGKLQAETLEMRQRVTLAERAAQEARGEAVRKAAAARAAIEEALAEGKKLKKEAEQHEALRAQMDSEIARASSQASALSDRFAEAEQELRFETTRNADRRRAKDEENSRLRAASAAAEMRLAAAEGALRCKAEEIEDLRSRAAKQGLNSDASAATLRFRVFAAAANAWCAKERCSEVASERRASAGSAMADALRAAGSEAAVEADRRAASLTNFGDVGEGKMAEARRLVGASAANERREVAGLALRRAEAKLRRTADLSLRTSLDHQPSREDSRRPPDATSRLAPVTSFGGGAHPTFESEPMLNDTTFVNKPLAENTSKACGVVISEASGTCCFPSSSSVAEGGGGDSVHRVRMTGDQSGSGTKRDCPTSTADELVGEPPAGGLQELREEIADLEGKILRRLGGGGGGGHESGRKSFCEGRSCVGGGMEGWDASSAEAFGPAKRSMGGMGAATEKGRPKAPRPANKIGADAKKKHLGDAGAAQRRRGSGREDRGPARSSDASSVSRGQLAASRDTHYPP